MSGRVSCRLVHYSSGSRHAAGALRVGSERALARSEHTADSNKGTAKGHLQRQTHDKRQSKGEEGVVRPLILTLSFYPSASRTDKHQTVTLDTRLISSICFFYSLALLFSISAFLSNLLFSLPISRSRSATLSHSLTLSLSLSCQRLGMRQQRARNVREGRKGI